MLIRREAAADIPAVRDVHAAAFAGGTIRAGAMPVEVPLLDALRTDPGWLPALSMVAVRDGRIVGHVVCTRADINGRPALGLGPLGVLPAEQATGVGSALMHAILGAADALDEPIVVLLGHRDYYPRFGFRPAAEYAVEPPDPTWAAYFQVRPLAAYTPDLRGPFTYAAPFADL
jgi:putative acetyltransferase